MKRGCLSWLAVLALALIALTLVVFMMNGGSFGGNSSRSRASTSGNMTCRSDTTIMTGIRGIGVNAPEHVTVSLKDSAGRTVVPTDRTEDVTDRGTRYNSLIYMQPRVSLGTYTVEVTHNGRVIETETLRLTASDSPVITFVCP